MFFRIVASLLFLDAAACFVLPIILAENSTDMLAGMAMLWPIGALIACGGCMVWKS